MCNFDRYGLHAKQLEFFHPRSKSLINFESKLPTEFIKLVKELENLSGY